MIRWLILIALLLAIAPRPVLAQSSQAENPCPYTARITNLSASATLIGSSGKSIRICFFTLSLADVVSTTAQLVWGTQTTNPCDTNTAAASGKIAVGGVASQGNVTTTAGDGLGFIDEGPVRAQSTYCLVVSGSNPAVDGLVKYGLY